MTTDRTTAADDLLARRIDQALYHLTRTRRLHRRDEWNVVRAVTDSVTAGLASRDDALRAARAAVNAGR